MVTRVKVAAMSQICTVPSSAAEASRVLPVHGDRAHAVYAAVVAFQDGARVAVCSARRQ
jgi:hypothetical protein